MLKAPPPLLLASSSRYRAELLARLRLPFASESPDIDEQPAAGEAPATLALRLARTKAAALRPRHPQDWIIGSDQVAVTDDRVLGKPGHRARAIEQLTLASGREVRFETAVALSTPDGRFFEAVDSTCVRFRELTTDQIARYVDAEQPFDCAGSFKCEGYGITLFEAIESRDPTALIGLPLIALCGLLRDAGYTLP
ncbi:MAG: nucleoside triphosphate pyrophosphatase [Pseudomonadota bacterium]|nr:nucleoside triphosphate pyrophosphatase [Pseudomonadota bacterium]